ncbi:MAG: hypothetical protein MI919_12820 [Holophagales bacterium]|nr:hypothetical protein [Holophagales bacterium]
MSASVYRRVALPALVIGLLVAGHLYTMMLGAPPLRSFEIFSLLHLRLEPSASWWGLGILVAGLAVAWRLPAARADRWIGACLAWVDRRAWVLAAAVALGLAVASLTVYHGHPLSMDETTAVFQAQLFAAGKLWAEFQPDLLDRLIPHKFQGYFYASDPETGRVMASYWPGFALLLTPFVLLGAPWLLNPVLAAAVLLLLRYIARELFADRESGAWVMLLAVASPQLAAYGISFYSMGAHLALNLGFAALLLRPTPARVFAAGLVGSLALVLHQPVPHPLFALPWILWLLFRHDRWKLISALALGYLPATALLGVAWGGWVARLRAAGTVAEPLATSAAAAGQPASEPGATSILSSAFGALEGGLRLFAVPDLQLLYYRMLELEKLILWAVPALPVLAFWGWWAGRRRSGEGGSGAEEGFVRGAPAVQLFALSAVLSFLGYLFVPLNQGHGWGFRYFHQAWGILPLLAAGAVVTYGRERPEWKRLAFALAVLSLVVATPLRFAQIHQFIGEQLAQLPPPATDADHQIRFIDIERPYYREDLIQNDPLLRDPVLDMVSFGREADEEFVRQSFPHAELVYDDGVDTVWRLD